jgi:aspartyl protease
MIDVMLRWLPVALIAVLSAAVLASPASAQFFRYLDERGNAFYVDGIDNVPPQYRAAAVPLGLRNSPSPASTPPAGGRVRPLTAGVATIRYVPGQRIMVEVTINGSSNATLLLDTGADRTLISPRALQAAGVVISRPVGIGRVSGVTGTDQVQYVVVDSLAIGQARVARIPVVAYEMPGTQGDGLLGRDFLDQFRINIDSAAGLVTLEPK